MPVPFEAMLFPDRHPIYEQLRDRAAIGHHSINPIPVNLAHLYRLNMPAEGWDHPNDASRYGLLETDLSTDEIPRYYDLELQAYKRIRLLLGGIATEATIPLEITDDPHRTFTDAAATVAIHTPRAQRRKRHAPELESLSAQISGVCTAGALGNERFSVNATIICRLSQADRGQLPTQPIPGARLVTLFQFWDALDYIGSHSTTPLFPNNSSE